MSDHLEYVPARFKVIRTVRPKLACTKCEAIFQASALGQAVQFIDHRTGQMRRGKLIARHDNQATVLEEDVRRTWKIPYVAIEGAPAAPGSGAKPYEPPPEPAMPRGQSTFQIGDKVTFDDAKGTAQVAIVTRINRRTATLEAMDGRT